MRHQTWLYCAQQHTALPLWQLATDCGATECAYIRTGFAEEHSHQAVLGCTCERSLVLLLVLTGDMGVRSIEQH